MANHADKNYLNDPKFLDRQVWANTADPNQRSSLIRVRTICNFVQHLLDTLLYGKANFTAKFSGVRSCRIFTLDGSFRSSLMLVSLFTHVCLSKYL